MNCVFANWLYGEPQGKMTRSLFILIDDILLCTSKQKLYTRSVVYEGRRRQGGKDTVRLVAKRTASDEELVDVIGHCTDQGWKRADCLPH